MFCRKALSGSVARPLLIAVKTDFGTTDIVLEKADMDHCGLQG